MKQGVGCRVLGVAVLMVLAVLQTCAQTSEFRRLFQRTNGLPLIGATVYLVPQISSYPEGALLCTADPSRPGVYYRLNVSDGEYRIYIDQGAGAVQFQEHVFLGEKRLTDVADRFDSNKQLMTVGIKDQAVTNPKLADATITQAKLAPSLVDFINSAGGGTITNHPDEITVTQNGSSQLGVKLSGIVGPNDLVVAPAFSGYPAPFYSTIKNALAAATSGMRVIVKPATYVFAASDSITIPAGVSMLFEKGAVITGGRTYPSGVTTLIAFYPSIIVGGDNVTVDGLVFEAKDSISCVIKIRQKKGFVLKNSTITTDKGDGTLIHSIGGRNYFKNNTLKHNYSWNTNNTFSVYAYNTVGDGNSPRDTLYDETSYWESGAYCYGGTVNGDAWINASTMWSKSNPTGGNCLNLYAGSRAWAMHCKLYGRISAATENHAGKPISTRLIGCYIRGDKVHGADWVQEPYADSLWVDGCTIELPYELSSGPINSTTGSGLHQSWQSWKNTTITGLQHSGNMSYAFGLNADVGDSSIYIIDNVRMKDVMISFGPRALGRVTARPLVQATDWHVVNDKSFQGSLDYSFGFWGLHPESYFRSCSFVSDSVPTVRIGWNSYASGVGYGDDGAGTARADSSIEWDDVYFGGVKYTDVGNPDPMFQTGVNSIFNLCRWDYRNSKANIGIRNSATVTINNGILHTSTSVAFSAVGGGAPTVNISHSTIVPPSPGAGVKINWLKDPETFIGWTPGQLSNVLLWIEAENASATTATDLSSNGRNMGAGTGITMIAEGINGRPTMHATNGLMAQAAGTTMKATTWTVYVVAKTTGSRAGFLGENSGTRINRLGAGLPGTNNMYAFDSLATGITSNDPLTVPRTQASLFKFRHVLGKDSIFFSQNGAPAGVAGLFVNDTVEFSNLGASADMMNGDYAMPALVVGANILDGDSLDVLIQKYAAKKWDLYTIFDDVKVLRNLNVNGFVSSDSSAGSAVCATGDSIQINRVGVTTSSIIVASYSGNSAAGASDIAPTVHAYADKFTVFGTSGKRVNYWIGKK